MTNRKETAAKRLVSLFVGLGLLSAACGAPARPDRSAAALAPTGQQAETPDAKPDRARRHPKPMSTPPATAWSPAPSSPAPAPSPTETEEPPGDRGETIPASLIGTQWYTLPTTEKVVALTFDAGANAEGIPSILATLAAHDVPATFFLTGKWVEVYPDHAAQIGAKYPVANHSYSHPDLTQFSDGLVEREITGANDRIERATGQNTRPMFRFPFGASDARTIGIANSLGYGCINWTVDTRGWQGTSGGQSAALIVDRVMNALQPGEIVIMHVGSHPADGSTLDADALPRIIEEIRARGYGFVTIDQYL
jgi:peptidoglycan/xylan/chitin deacetylase (PgdA/CDA1 family)